MCAQLALADQMTIEEFLAFADARPDWEKWELIEGCPTMSPSPTDWHQLIVQNIGAALNAEKLRQNATWIALPGVGTRVPISPNSLPQPDLFVKEGALTGQPTTDDALVIVEVLSRSNTPADQAWRRRVYGSVPNCQHYVTVSMKRAEVTRYDRSIGWKPGKATGLAAELALPCIDVTLPLAHIYRWTPIA